MGNECTRSSREKTREGPRTWVVAQDGGDFTSLGDAVMAARPWDRIVISPGVYMEPVPIVIDIPLEIISAVSVAEALASLPLARTGGPTLGASIPSTSSATAAGGGATTVGIELDTSVSNSNKFTTPSVKLTAHRCRLVTVDLVDPTYRVSFKGISMGNGSEEHPVLFLSKGRLNLDDCELSGGQDCVAVGGLHSVIAARNCSVHNAAHAAMSFSGSSRGMLEDCRFYSCPTGLIISSAGNPSLFNCTIATCGTGILVRDAGLGTLTRCTIERNTKPGVIIAAKGNPLLRQCVVRDGDSNGVFVRDEGRGVLSECQIYGNGLPGVAACNDSSPVLVGCTISDGRNAGVLVYDNGRGVIADCSIHDNHMPGIEVRAGGNPVVASCEIYNGESNGIYVHNRGRGVFSSCRVYENVLPGIAIRTAGNPLVHTCSVTTGKDNALMVCDKGKGVVVECALHGYSARPLEVRDGCTPLLHSCEMHDGKHRHVLDWLQKINHSLTPQDIQILSWDRDHLARSDVLAEDPEDTARRRRDDPADDVADLGDSSLPPRHSLSTILKPAFLETVLQNEGAISDAAVSPRGDRPAQQQQQADERNKRQAGLVKSKTLNTSADGGGGGGGEGDSDSSDEQQQTDGRSSPHRGHGRETPIRKSIAVTGAVTPATSTSPALLATSNTAAGAAALATNNTASATKPQRNASTYAHAHHVPNSPSNFAVVGSNGDF